jgi:O-acetyl-ADP-ribose deacetylase (regulator of RNase III)
MTRWDVITGNITRCAVDAVVNAANSSLLGGGGVDGAIHRAAGPELVHECRLLGGCKTGQAKMTKGYRLPARHIIHTVGPVWRGGGNGEPELLARCYRGALELARKHSLRSLAFPAISTGIYGYPMAAAAEVAASTVADELKATPEAFDRIVFVCFDDPAAAIHRAAVSRFGAAWLGDDGA